MIPDGAFGVDWYIGNSYGTLRTSVVATTMRTTFTRMVPSSLSTGISRIPTGLFNSPGTYNWDVAGYVNKYGETYSSTSVNNSDYDSCCDYGITYVGVFYVGSDGDIYYKNWEVAIEDSYGKINHSYQSRVRALKI